MKGRTWCFASLLAAALLAPLGARADDCDRTVVDGAGVIGNDVSRVETAAQKLVNAGAAVRVRTVMNNGGYASLDLYEAAEERRCQSWQAPDGGTRNTLVVFMVSFGDQRGAGLYYGTQWAHKLDAEWPTVLTAQVTPRLRDGNFAAAFEAGLNEIARVVAAKPTSAAGPTTIVNKPATNLSGLWWVLGAVVVLGAIVVIFFLLRARRRERERRQAAQQKAQAVKAGCATYIGQFDDATLAVLEAEINTAAETASEEDAKPLRQKMSAVRTAVNAATMEFAELQGSKSDPSIDGCATQTYEQIAAAYDGILKKLRAANATMDEIKSGCARLEKLVGEVPGKIADAKKAIQAADEQQKVVKSEGYKTPDSDQQMTFALEELDNAEDRLKQKRFGQAAESAFKAAAWAGSSAASAAAMPVRRQQIESGIAALKSRIADVESKIDAGAGVFKEISSTFAESCWTTIRGNGSEAESGVDQAEECLAQAGTSAAMERQAWDEADAAVKDGNAALDRVESLMRSIHALKSNLDAARRDAPKEIADAEADIVAARKFIKEHDADVRDSLETDLDNAAKSVGASKAELAKAKPDYLMVVKIAKAANAAADTILAQARSEHEAAEKQRQRAVSSMRDAKASVSAAKEYVEDHASDVGAAARSQLSNAQTLLQSATETQNLADRISFAEQSDKAADQALSSAQGDVRRAKAAREAAAAAAERRRQSTIPVPRIGLPSLPKIGGGSRGGGSVSIGKSSRGGGSVGW